jgi:hypothetical protein
LQSLIQGAGTPSNVLSRSSITATGEPRFKVMARPTQTITPIIVMIWERMKPDYCNLEGDRQILIFLFFPMGRLANRRAFPEVRLQKSDETLPPTF